MRLPKSGIVVGCGSIGQRHLRNAVSLGLKEIIGVDRSETAQKEASALGATETYSNIESALRQHSPEFGIVAVPNHIHVPVAQQLADKELDLFIEKPLSHSQEGIPDLIDTVETHDLVTLVGCNFRFQPGIRKLRKLLQQKRIGSILSVQIEAGSYLPNWHPDEDYREMYSAQSDMGGGAILDYIHELNYCRWLFGEITEVTAMTSSMSHLDLETEDVGAIIMKTRDGAICEIHVDYVQQSSTRSCKVIGDKGTLTWDLDRHTIERYDPTSEEWIVDELPNWKFNDMYVEELKHFFSCIESRSASVCDLSEGYTDLQIARSALKSAESGEHISLTQ